MPRPPRFAGSSRCWSAAVETYFSFSGPSPALILPTGGVDLLVIRDVIGHGAPPVASIHGYITESFLPPPQLELSCVGIRFRPGGFTAVSGIPQDQVSGGIFDLADWLSPRQIDRICSIAMKADNRPEALEPVLNVLATNGSIPSWLQRFQDVLGAERPDVDRLAECLELSHRHLLRLSRRYFGVGPKKLMRVLRLREALNRRLRSASWVDVALATGYSDQAHLSRECRSILEMSPQVLLRLVRTGRVFRI